MQVNNRLVLSGGALFAVVGVAIQLLRGGGGGPWPPDGLADFAAEWLSPFEAGLSILLVAAGTLGLLHLLQLAAGKERPFHLLQAGAAFAAALALLTMSGFTWISVHGERVFSTALFLFSGAGSLAANYGRNGKVGRRAGYAFLVIALSFLLLPWLSPALKVYLLGLVLLFWGIDALLDLGDARRGALLYLGCYLPAILLLMATLLLERFGSGNPGIQQSFPALALMLLLLAPTVTHHVSAEHEQAQLTRNLAREREQAKKSLSRELRRVEAEQGELLRAARLEAVRLHAALVQHTGNIREQLSTGQPTAMDAIGMTEPELPAVVEEMPEPGDAQMEPADEGKEKGPGESIFPVEEFTGQLKDLLGGVDDLDHTLIKLRVILSDLLGQVAVEEQRIAEPMDSAQERVKELAAEIDRLLGWLQSDASNSVQSGDGEDNE